MRKRSVLSVIAALAFVASGLSPVDVAEGASDPWQPPRLVQSIGGMGRPGVFSWGAQYNPVTDEVIVGDYLHFTMRRYDTDGNYLGDFWRDEPCGQPYSIGVDPNDGSVYVSELKDNPLTVCIAKYDSAGNFLFAKDVNLDAGDPDAILAFYTVWLTVDNAGDVWVMDSHFAQTESFPPRMLQVRFDDATESADVISSFAILPEGMQVPRLYGVDISSDGVLFVSDAYNGVLHRYQTDGTYLGNSGFGQLGFDNRGVALNEDLDRVYVVDAQNSDIDVFNQAGEYQFSFGSEGTGPGQFTGGGRQVTIDDDGNVWVADFGGFRTVKFDADGNPLLTAPIPSRLPPAGYLGQPRDVAVDPVNGEVWVADTWNQRFQRFSQNGEFLNTYGQRGPGGAFNMNYPRTVAVQPGNRNIWVANERGHHIQVYTNGGQYIRQIGSILEDNSDPGNFRWPVDIEFYDGRAIIGDRMSGYVKIFSSSTYQEILQFRATNHGTAVDPATGNIYVLNGSADEVRVFDQTGTELFRFGSTGSGPGEFQDPVDAVIVDEVLYVVDESNSNVQSFELDGTYRGRWGEGYSSSPYSFKNPVGIDHDAQGRLYVTDSANDRIQVFDPGQARRYETIKPNLSISSPASGSQLASEGTLITGTASDDTTVANIEIAVQDYSTGQWWNASNATWQSAKVHNLGAQTGAKPMTNVMWSWVFNGVDTNGEYIVEARARDHSGNVSNSSVITFALGAGVAPPNPGPPNDDLTAPVVVIGEPTVGALLPIEEVTIGGTATDNVALAQVRVAFRDVDSGRWWTGTSFGTGFRWYGADLDDPEGPEVNWTTTWTPPGPGNYRVLVEALDSSANGSIKRTRDFTVAEPVVDEEAPVATISSPPNGSTIPVAAATITGSATDNIAVAAVEVGIRDVVDDLWWNGANFVPGYVGLAATLASPNTTNTVWSLGFTPPGEGSFELSVQATDAGGNSQQVPASSTFSAAGGPDLAPPNGTVDSPGAGEVLGNEALVLSGQATDDVGVGQVLIAIRNAVTSQWWTGTGWGGWTTLPATLTAPGAASTGWSYDWTPPATGNYNLWVRADDTSGNQDPTKPWVNFSVADSGPGPDSTPPNATVTTPTNGQSLPSGAAVLSGQATDDVGVGQVLIAIRNAATSQWWTGTGWGGWTTLPATLTAPGAASTGWSYDWTPPATGNYNLWVRADDTSGNQDPTKPWVNFSIS